MELELIPHITESLRHQAPLLIMAIGGLLVLAADVLLPAAMRWLLAVLSATTLVIALATLHCVAGPDVDADSFFGGLRSSGFIFYAQNIILAGGLVLVMISPRYIHDRAIPQGEYYAILLFAIMSMVALAGSTELLTLFLNIELLSIALYILAGLEKRNLRATEAAFKYFLLGSFAAAFLLFGIGFVFGATGETTYNRIAQAMAGGGGLSVIQPSFLVIGIGLMLVGFAFKLTLVPFHMYAPDVYEGSPTPIAALIATGAKVASFAAFYHFVQLISAWPALPKGVWLALWLIVAASMIIGNVGAIVQPSLKRMLAYSSISHSGYMALPLVVMLGHPGSIEFHGAASTAMGFYMLAYSVMTLLAFGIAASLGRNGETAIANYSGLWRRNPVMALIMAVALLSLLGMPPTIGFFGKVMLFKVAVDGAQYWLAVLGVLTSVMSAYYYLRVIVTMFMEEPRGEELAVTRGLDGINWLALAVCSLGIFAWIFLFI